MPLPIILIPALIMAIGIITISIKDHKYIWQSALGNFKRRREVKKRGKYVNK